MTWLLFKVQWSFAFLSCASTSAPDQLTQYQCRDARLELRKTEVSVPRHLEYRRSLHVQLPLFRTCFYPDATKLLLDSGAKIDALDSNEHAAIDGRL